MANTPSIRPYSDYAPVLAIARLFSCAYRWYCNRGALLKGVVAWLGVTVWFLVLIWLVLLFPEGTTRTTRSAWAAGCGFVGTLLLVEGLVHRYVAALRGLILALPLILAAGALASQWTSLRTNPSFFPVLAAVAIVAGAAYLLSKFLPRIALSDQHFLVCSILVGLSLLTVGFLLQLRALLYTCC